jgi:hypothetical protein
MRDEVKLLRKGAPRHANEPEEALKQKRISQIQAGAKVIADSGSNDNVLAELQFGFGDDGQVAGAAATALTAQQQGQRESATRPPVNEQRGHTWTPPRLHAQVFDFL